MESLVSVGIDVGTTTTQVIFSRLFLENTAGYFTVPNVSIVQKQVIYRSEPRVTPLLNDTEIDAAGVEQIVRRAYEEAHQTPKAVATGAVIITGESAKKENAAKLLNALAGLAGDFVAETAGPDLEAVIAGKGSGAEAYSIKNHCRVLNLDIGGGTTNAVLFENGTVVSTGCIEVGGRHIRTDNTGRILSFTPAAEKIAGENGLHLEQDSRDTGTLLAFVTAQTRLCCEMAGLYPRSDLYRAVMTHGSSEFDCSRGFDAICFSGGVADAVFGRFSGGDDYRFGDIGILLGRAIAKSPLYLGQTVLHSEETIRATVVGAGTHTTSVSGSTIWAAREALPIRNMPVLHLNTAEIDRIAAGDVSYFAERLKTQLAQQDEDNAAIGFTGDNDPSYEKIKRLSSALVAGASAVLPEKAPIVVVTYADMAKATGQVMRQLTQRPVIAIDCIATKVHDRIDIGRPMVDDLVVQVVVKTLIFGQ